MRKKMIVLTGCIIFLLTGTAAEADWQEAGVRIGIQAGPKHEYFRQYEAFAVYGLPWDWRMSSGWGLAPRLNLSAGTLVGGNTTGFIGSAGAGLIFNKPGSGIALEAGASFNLLDRASSANRISEASSCGAPIWGLPTALPAGWGWDIACSMCQTTAYCIPTGPRTPAWICI